MSDLVSAAAKANVLVVDDEESIRAFLTDALAEAGHRVAQAADGEAALALLAASSFDVVLTDLKMPHVDGAALLRQIRQDYPETEVIVLTAHGSIASAVDAMRHGAFDYLQKPVSSPAELRLTVGRAVERHRLRAFREVHAASGAPPLTYGAPAMATAEKALRKVAATDATVLLLGESGSPELLESELFGHERGAFTGAHARQRGRIELATGGTFFLDEIGELAPGLQAKLLRVLQEKRFERVGGHQVVEADVRWVAATNRNLADMMQKGAFREDLYHRLSVFPLRLPSLRERREDIPPLARHLLGRAARDLGKPTLTLSEDAVAVLSAAAWPGNIRELANVLERSAILAERDEISADDLALLPGGIDDAAAATPTTVSEVERDAIVRALAATSGNRRLAAARLGIGLRTLYDKLKRYALD